MKKQQPKKWKNNASLELTRRSTPYLEEESAGRMLAFLNALLLYSLRQFLPHLYVFSVAAVFVYFALTCCILSRHIYYQGQGIFWFHLFPVIIQLVLGLSDDTTCKFLRCVEAIPPSPTLLSDLTNEFWTTFSCSYGLAVSLLVMSNATVGGVQFSC